MTDFDRLKETIERTTNFNVRTLTRKQVRALDTEDEDTLVALDDAQGDAGDDGVGIILVRGEPL